MPDQHVAAATGGTPRRLIPAGRASNAGSRPAQQAEPADCQAAAGRFVIVTREGRRPVQDSPAYHDLGAATEAAERANLRAALRGGASGPVYEVAPASDLSQLPAPDGLA